MLSLACEMGIIHKNSVHFAIMGRDDTEIDVLKNVNAITSECGVLIHGTYSRPEKEGLQLLNKSQMLDPTFQLVVRIPVWKSVLLQRSAI
jgi:hypothetical protein